MNRSRVTLVICLDWSDFNKWMKGHGHCYCRGLHKAVVAADGTGSHDPKDTDVTITDAATGDIHCMYLLETMKGRGWNVL